MARALVTGANRGIGLELCRLLKARGDEVIATCRRASAALDGLGVRVERDIDVGADDSIRQLVERLAPQPLDLLINNAGVMMQERLPDLAFDHIRQQFEVNALGPLRLTASLLPLLRAGAKVAMITSRMGSIGDNTSGGRYGYRMSKAALNMAAVSLAHDLAPQGIAVAILHPGFVQTEMTGGQGDITADVSARNLLARIDALTLEKTGTFWHANGERLPW